MANPLVSVCLITYNHQEYIKQAIDSIMMQKVNFCWEIIIADDFSKDNTRNIILDLTNRHPTLIKLLFQERNVGPGKNFIDLINKASGKYIAYLEGDDYWIDPEKLQKQFDFMEMNPTFSMCYHQSNRVYTKLTDWAKKNPQKAPHYVSNEDDSPVSDIFDILNKGWFIFSSTIFFRNFRLPMGFEYLNVGDYPLHILLASQGKIGFIKESMSVYRINHNGQSTMRLHTSNFQKRENNFKEEVLMYRYLDAETKFKYSKYFKKIIFDLIYSHILFTYKNNKNKMWSTLTYCVKAFGLIPIIARVSSKIFRKVSKNR